MPSSELTVAEEAEEEGEVTEEAEVPREPEVPGKTETSHFACSRRHHLMISLFSTFLFWC